MEERECYSCGFLAKYCPESSIPTPRYFEVEQKERTDGNLFQHALEVGHVPRRSYPTCYRQVPEVLQEFLPYTDLVHKDQTHVVQIINRKRICSEWCEYIPGFSPKERFEQVKMLELERLRTEFEQRMESDRKDFELKLFQAGKKYNFWIAFILGGIAVFEILVGVLQLAYPTGLPRLVEFVQQSEWFQWLLGQNPESLSPPPL